MHGDTTIINVHLLNLDPANSNLHRMHYYGVQAKTLIVLKPRNWSGLIEFRALDLHGFTLVSVHVVYTVHK